MTDYDGSWHYHTEFLYELSKLFPNLQSLKFPCFKHFRDGINEMGLNRYIGDLHIRLYFPKLIYLKLEVNTKFDLNYQKYHEFYDRVISDSENRSCKEKLLYYICDFESESIEIWF